MQLLPNFFWIEGRASNIYLWQAEAGLLMVDTGMPGDTEKILAYMTANGLDKQGVFAILITHADIDHAGGAAALADRFQAPIYASAATAGYLATGKSPKHLPRLVQFISDRFFGYKPVAGNRVRIVADGQRVPELENWQALATPGHCDDHFSFYSPTHGVLFAGDALNTRGDTLGLGAKRITADQPQAARSARRLLALTPAVLACGHGRPFVHHDAADIMMLFQQLGNLATQRR
jgi:glyoxylase-like metal-dependent hydrolase (beta-lactamase superfamily II)